MTHHKRLQWRWLNLTKLASVFFRKTGKRAPLISPNSTSVSDCPSHGSLGRTWQKLHPKVVNNNFIGLSSLPLQWGQPAAKPVKIISYGHRHVTYGLVTTLQKLTINTTSSQNHKVVEQNNLVETFRAIRLLIHDHRSSSPWWLEWIIEA